MLPFDAAAVPAIVVPAKRATASGSECAGSRCTKKLTAEQMLAVADRLVSSGRFDEAQPYLKALKLVTALTMERQFLEGIVALETDDLATAEARFRSVLSTRPDMTRARLELARVLMSRGVDRAAEYHFRLAEEDQTLDDDVRRTVYAARSVIRDRERWSLQIGFGLAPDTNINSATTDRTLDLQFGDVVLPLELSPEARKTTGLGQTASLSAQGRFSLADRIAFAGRFDTFAVNYQGTFADDVSASFAAGPEYSMNGRTRFSLEGVAAGRSYGGRLVARQIGLRFSGDKRLARGGSIGFEVDGRRATSKINNQADGWSYTARLAHERVLSRSIFAGASIFGRRDSLASLVYANSEAGFTFGVGGEIPFGLNVGASGLLSRVWYDGALAVLSPDARRDLRYSTRLYAASRRVRVHGFSPSVSYVHSRGASSLNNYDFSRHRLEFQVTQTF